MASKTKIPWTQTTINPVMGCTPHDESCRNCYALAMMRRYRGQKGYPVHENTVTLFPERLAKLAKMRKPKLIFMPSMGDLFHKDVPMRFISQTFEVIAQTPHVYQILTKRISRAKEFFDRWKRLEGRPFDLKNVQLGVSIGAGQHIADRDIPILLDIPAAARFVSVEPMLQGINLEKYLMSCEGCGNKGSTAYVGWENNLCQRVCIKNGDSPSLDLVIAGCESGPKRRHISTDAFRHLRDQCVDAGVPFFLKQLEVGGKVVKMPELDGEVWDEMPKVNFSQPLPLQTSF